MKLYNIIYKDGSNEIELFDNIKGFGKWWAIMVKLGNRKKGSIESVKQVS